MTVLREDDFIQSICDGFQFIACYHPPDYLRALRDAYEREQAPAARDAIRQILANSRLSALGHRPICQDTGICVVFLKVGMNVRWQTTRCITSLVNEGVRRAYLHPDNPLRASILEDPAGQRRNTGDNTPAVVHVELVPGDTVEVYLAAKGGGSENKARFAVLNPADSIVDWVSHQVPGLGGDWCPPGLLGIGIGGTPEKAMLLAKFALIQEPINIHELMARGPQSRAEELRLQLYHAVNALGVGAQGLGGMTTVLDVKVLDHPTHAASLPVALIPNCAATRHLHFTLDGSGPVRLAPPRLEDWPDIGYVPEATAKRLSLDGLTREALAGLRAGDRVLLSGKLLTGRDAAHRRLADSIARGLPLPVDLRNRVLYYVGPVAAVGKEAVGPAGPTTARRMDPYTPLLLEKTGLIGMVGKSERGPEVVRAIAAHGAVYFIAVGGAAYLISQAIRSARVLAFPELGMEAMYEFEVQDMPVTVAVDSLGNSVHDSGPREWRTRLGRFHVTTGA